MHGTPEETRKLLAGLREQVSGIDGREIVVFPPFTSLPLAGPILAGGNIDLGAQNVHWETNGAFTGEISAGMLVAAGCRWAIVGHSERRHHFGESDDTVNRRARAALAAGLQVIVCVGETLKDREVGKTLEVVGRQTRGALLDLDSDAMQRVCIAYEPVWAIGTGKTATPQQAQEVHTMIRGLVAEVTDAKIAGSVRILYGGSVKPDNVDALMVQPDLDGALVGGASLDARSFTRIVAFREN